MVDAPDPTMPGARFPYAAAAFSCACVAAAVWTFMLFSYAWTVTPSDFEQGRDPPAHPMVGRYVEMLPGVDAAGRGFVPIRDMIDIGQFREDLYVAIADAQGDQLTTKVRGRVVVRWTLTSGPYPFLAINADAGRWPGASVAGPVVGAMGVFIFALHLRRWLRVRRLAADAGRAFTAEEAEDADIRTGT